MAAPRLLITRAAEDQSRTMDLAAQAGFDPLSVPLLSTMEIPFDLPVGPPPLLFTSPRAPAIAAARHPHLRGIRCYAVGTQTGEAVRAAGFADCIAGNSDGSAIVATAHAHGETRLLHLTGEDVAHLIIPPGITVDRRAIYRAVAADHLPARALDAMRAGAFAMLLSPRTASIFARLHDAAGLVRSLTTLAVISPAAAQAAGQGWRAIAVATQPDLPATLAAARKLWHKQCDARTPE